MVNEQIQSVEGFNLHQPELSCGLVEEIISQYLHEKKTHWNIADQDTSFISQVLERMKYVSCQTNKQYPCCTFPHFFATILWNMLLSPNRSCTMIVSFIFSAFFVSEYDIGKSPNHWESSICGEEGMYHSF